MFIRATLSTTVMLLLIPLAALAQAEVPDAELQTFFETGWGKGVSGLRQAEELYERLGLTDAEDARLHYAAALVRMKHHRYRDAVEPLTRALELQPNHLAARRAQVWLLMLRKQYAEAFVEMQQLSDRLPRDEEERAELVAFLGRMFGFLDAPAAGALPEDELAQRADRISAALDAGDRAAFDQARQGVRQAYAQLLGEADKTQAAAEVEKRVEQQQARDQLSDEKSAVAKDKDAVQQRAFEARTYAENQVGELDKEMAPLEREYAILVQQARVIQVRIVDLETQAGRLRALAEAEEDELRRASLRRQADLLLREATLFDRDLARLDAQATRLNVQYTGLLRKRQAIVADYEAEMKRLGVAFKGLSRKENKLDASLRKASQPVTGKTPRVRSLRRQAAALTTYDQFPLEIEKQRLLDSLE